MILLKSLALSIFFCYNEGRNIRQTPQDVGKSCDFLHETTKS